MNAWNFEAYLLSNKPQFLSELDKVVLKSPIKNQEQSGKACLSSVSSIQETALSVLEPAP